MITMLNILHFPCAFVCFDISLYLFILLVLSPPRLVTGLLSSMFICLLLTLNYFAWLNSAVSVFHLKVSLCIDVIESSP